MALKSTIKSKIAPKAPQTSSAPALRHSIAKDADVKVEETAKGESFSSSPKPKKVCFYCESKTEPSYTDSVALRKFMSDRAKINSKLRSGACSKHQRKITREIKHARHLALLPFIARV